MFLSGNFGSVPVTAVKTLINKQSILKKSCETAVNYCHFYYLKSNNYFENDVLKTSWKRVKKQQWRTYPLIFHARDLSGILKFDCLLLWKPVETPCRFPRNFQCKETRWNYRVDCFQVWKLVESTCDVSPKFPMQGI